MFYNLGFLSSCFWTCLLQRAVLFCICPEDSVDPSVSCPRNGAKRAGTKHQGEKGGDKCARRQDELLSPCTFKNGTHCQWEPFQGRAPADGSSCWEPVPGDTAKSNCQRSCWEATLGAERKTVKNLSHLFFPHVNWYLILNHSLREGRCRNHNNKTPLESQKVWMFHRWSISTMCATEE